MRRQKVAQRVTHYVVSPVFKSIGRVKKNAKGTEK